MNIARETQGQLSCKVDAHQQWIIEKLVTRF